MQRPFLLQVLCVSEADREERNTEITKIVLVMTFLPHSMELGTTEGSCWLEWSTVTMC
jgi:hypothetical protein